jgi:hypothetical protein
MKDRVAEIVAAYVGHNSIAPDQLPALIVSVSQALGGLGQVEPALATAPTPAVPVRRSVGAEKITCLDCGWSGQMLKRHLSTAHAMSPGDYRARWNLGLTIRWSPRIMPPAVPNSRKPSGWERGAAGEPGLSGKAGSALRPVALCARATADNEPCQPFIGPSVVLGSAAKAAE